MIRSRAFRRAGSGRPTIGTSSRRRAIRATPGGSDSAWATGFRRSPSPTRACGAWLRPAAGDPCHEVPEVTTGCVDTHRWLAAAVRTATETGSVVFRMVARPRAAYVDRSDRSGRAKGEGRKARSGAPNEFKEHPSRDRRAPCSSDDLILLRERRLGLSHQPASPEHGGAELREHSWRR